MKCFIIIIFLGGFTFSLNAQHWQSLNNGLEKQVVMCMYNDSASNLLYISGHFKYADSIVVNGIATWNGSTWDSVGTGFSYCISNCSVFKDILNYNGDIYAAGYPHVYNMPGNDLVNFVSKWNGTEWEVVDGYHYYDCHASCLYEFNEKLLVGGCFDSIGGIEAHQIAVWNDTVWSNFDTTNFDGTVGALIEYKNELYAGGNFDTHSGLHEIARWNGIQWYPVGNGINGDSWVNCFAIYNNELYVGGYFDKSSGNAGNFIQKWDGSNWHDVGNGMFPGQILDMVVYNDALWVIGQFDYAGGVPAQTVAKWDGVNWCGLGNSFSNIASQIGIYNNELYVGGSFKTIDGDTMNYIAKWIGGDYVDTCSSVGVSEVYTETKNIQIYPNPSSNEVTIKFTKEMTGKKTITLFDIHGKAIRTISTDHPETVIDISQLPVGVYCVNVTGENYSKSERIVKLE